MAKRLSVAAKKIKTLMQEAGIKRPEGRTCYSHLKHLEDGALIAAYKDGAWFFWETRDEERLDDCLERNRKKNEPVVFLYMMPSGTKKEIVSLGPILARSTIKNMRYNKDE